MNSIRYLDVCSGYSAFTLGARGLGFECAGYSEIEPFPRAILEQRHGAVAVDWDRVLIGYRRHICGHERSRNGGVAKARLFHFNLPIWIAAASAHLPARPPRSANDPSPKKCVRYA